MLLWGLPLAGIFILYLYQRVGPDTQAGMQLVFEAGFNQRESIPLRLIPLVTLSTWLTHLTGGSAGREGVAVQIGATVASRFRSLLADRDLRPILVQAGMAAGFSGLFQIPLAATFFAMEVLTVGQLDLHGILPIALAAATANWTSHSLGLEKFTSPLSLSFDWSVTHIVKLLLFGILAGLVGKGFAMLLARIKTYITAWFPHSYYRIVIIGLGLSLLLFLLWQGRYSGLGTNLIQEATTQPQRIHATDWLFKLLLTVLTLAAGFQGGEVTPLFAIGASLGAVCAPWIGLPASLAVACGYLTVFGAATNTFLAPIFIGGEVFGFEWTAAYAIVMIAARSLPLDHSIYSSQKIRKPASL